jgi:ATP-dependent RNA helicase DeaD
MTELIADDTPPTPTFAELGLDPAIVRAITDTGYTTPTPIQAAAIPAVMGGRDLKACAQTGTGKTAAFAIPVIEKIDTTKKTIQAVILCPTRELAIQISEEFQKLLKYKRHIMAVPVYGGQPIYRQIQSLRQKPQILIATPGRMMDHIERKTVSLSDVNIIVLDEADEMLNTRFPRTDLPRRSCMT